jgi:hypothetical protein
VDFICLDFTEKLASFHEKRREAPDGSLQNIAGTGGTHAFVASKSVFGPFDRKIMRESGDFHIECPDGTLCDMPV